MRIVLYEDNPASFLPLTHLQAAFDLRCGIFTPWERAERLFEGASVSAFVRPPMADVIGERKQGTVNRAPEGPALFLNGAALLTAEAAGRLVGFAESDAVFVTPEGGTLGYAAATATWRRTVVSALEGGECVPQAPVPARVEMRASIAEHPWDLIGRNSAQLVEDSRLFPLGSVNPSARIAPSARLLGAESICIGAGAAIGEGAVLDATGGPVVVDDEAVVMHQAVLIGPVYVGRASKVKIAAKIYEGTSIGPVCKVGGEVEGSILHSYSNKQHEGFLGHSYLASWTNLGADTNTSDLKNTYKSVRMTLEGTEHNTGLILLGTVMADHAKCGINSMLTTGASIGVGSNLFGAGYFPAYVPSFAWGGAEGFREYRFEMCAAVAATVMARRGREFTEKERALLRAVFDSTARQRDAWRKA